MLPTIARESDAVVMIDQRKLPGEEVYVRCQTAAEVARAIKTMVIRGAPAIGVAAAMGLALGMRKSKATGTQKFAAEFLTGYIDRWRRYSGPDMAVECSPYFPG